MKPDKNKAPDWASYMAQDSDGRWAWYESKPIIAFDETRWSYITGNQGREWEYARVANWKDSLEEL